ncbi:MAG: nucleoside-diphosphate kinase [Candidatus Pacebacteria bacterium]|nr:nucleoside-diphosphate kinase [Candidatus Paceibacterota bacterium]
MHENLIYTLKQAETPPVLQRENLIVNKCKELSLEETEKLKLKNIIQVIESPSFAEAIEQGFITLAMIKPAEINLHGLSDVELAHAIKKAIQSPLEIIFELSLIFDEKTINEFYDGEPKRKQQELLPYVYKNKFQNRWEEFANLMMSGPTTVLLLWSNKGDAVSFWRTQMGDWNVEERRNPNTIRGQFALNNYNGIVHGSDSIESVKREINIINNYLKLLFES